MIAAVVLSFLSFLATLSEVGCINASDTESSISDTTCQLLGNKSSGERLGLKNIQTICLFIILLSELIISHKILPHKEAAQGDVVLSEAGDRCLKLPLLPAPD